MLLFGPLGKPSEHVEVLVAEQRPGAGVIVEERMERPPPLRQVFVFVIAEHTLVLHGELDALAGVRPAIDEVTHKNDTVALRRADELEQVQRLLETSVKVSYDDRACHERE